MTSSHLACRCSHPRDQHTDAGPCKRWELGCLCLHYVQRALGPSRLDNPPAVGAPKSWRWGYLPCGCRNDGYGRHVR